MVAKRDYTPLIGKTFGRWSVIGIRRDKTHSKAVCQCSCGTVKAVRVGTLENGESTSCGCYSKELSSERSSTHGFSNHRLFGVWIGMNDRCTESSRKDYCHYGGRGIKVCDRWKRKFDGIEDGFRNFLEDMSESFQEGLEIDRVDTNGNYEPSNCRWATRRTQVINRRPIGSSFDTHYIEYNGKTQCLSQWADEVGIPYRVLIDRLGKLEWTVEKAFTHPLKPRQIYICNGDDRFEIVDVLKSPPNYFYRAKRAGIPTYQYIANMFSGIFEVKISLTGVLHSIKPTSLDISGVKLNLTDSFVIYCQENGIVLTNESVV